MSNPPKISHLPNLQPVPSIGEAAAASPPRSTATLPISVMLSAAPTEHSTQASASKFHASAETRPSGPGLSNAAVTGVSVVACLVGITMVVGLGFLWWQRVTGSRVARLGPGEEVIGPNEGYLRQTYLSNMCVAHCSRVKEGSAYELDGKSL